MTTLEASPVGRDVASSAKTNVPAKAPPFKPPVEKEVVMKVRSVLKAAHDRGEASVPRLTLKNRLPPEIRGEMHLALSELFRCGSAIFSHEHEWKLVQKPV